MMLMVKTYSIYLRCTKEEKETIVVNAKLKKLNVSEFLRKKGLDFYIPDKDPTQMELADFLDA